MIDLVVARDLRDYLTTARILHTEMATDGKLRGHRLYDASATNRCRLQLPLMTAAPELGSWRR
jgi:hypothetical protein